MFEGKECKKNNLGQIFMINLSNETYYPRDTIFAKRSRVSVLFHRAWHAPLQVVYERQQLHFRERFFNEFFIIELLFSNTYLLL